MTPTRRSPPRAGTSPSCSTTSATGCPRCPRGRAPTRGRGPFTQLVPRRGPRGRGRGRAAAPAPLSVWRMTSEQTPVVWPLIASSGLPPTGAQMGIDLLSGGAFYCDPIGWVTDDDIPVTNPNVVVFGKPGRGKSATVKAFALRMLGLRLPHADPRATPRTSTSRCAGRWAWSRSSSATACPPGSTRWPSARSGTAGTGSPPPRPAAARRSCSPAGWCCSAAWSAPRHVPFGPVEETAVGEALRLLTGYRTRRHPADRAHHPAAVARPCDEPTDELVACCRYADRRHFLDATRTLRDALGSLVKGSLAGLFDDHTTDRGRLARPDPVAVAVPARPARRPGRRHRADLPELLGPGDARDRRARVTCASSSATRPGGRCASAPRR